MEKNKAVESTIVNPLSKETVYELRGVRTRLQNKEIDVEQAQSEITASKHIIQIMALELESHKVGYNA